MSVVDQAKLEEFMGRMVGYMVPALEGVEDKLKAGARVADIGCWHGAAVVAMAQAHPNSQIFGFDYHGPSIEVARPVRRGAADARSGLS